MTENVNPVEAFKSAYISVLDQTAEIMKQPIESAKKILAPALDAQKEVWSSISDEQAFATIKDIVSASAGYFESYSKQLSEGLGVAKRATETWKEVALAWQKVALEAQTNAFNAYKNWLGRIRA
jgi:hypothetical protein